MATPPPAVEPEFSLRTLEILTLDDEVIPIELDDLADVENTVAVVELLGQEKAPVKFWIRVAEEVWRLKRWSGAMDILNTGLVAFATDEQSTVPLLCMLSTYNLALARRAPKVVLEKPRTGNNLARPTQPDHPEAGANPDTPPKVKEDYWNTAAALLERVDRIAPGDKTAQDVKAALLMARGRLDEASKLFDSILAKESTHLMALAGKARILFARRSFRPALKVYQTILAYAPGFLPDPRVGAGLCFYMMGEKDRAQQAWERSIVVNPDTSISAQVLVGLALLNAARDPAHLGGDEGSAIDYDQGFKHIQAAFKRDNTVAAAGAPLAAFFLVQRDDTGYANALKLAERTIQFADSRLVLSEGHLYAARALEAQGKTVAFEEYAAAAQVNSDQLLAFLASAEALTRANDIPAAVNTFETILRRQHGCIEALVSLAAIHTHAAFSSAEEADSAVERKKAKELYDQVLRLFASNRDADAESSTAAAGKSERVRAIARDPQLFIEIARLWSDESGLERPLRAYVEASRIFVEELELDVPPQLSNNVGVLEFQRGDFGKAQKAFEDALTDAGVKAQEGLTEELDAVITGVMFNFGVVCEAMGDAEKAKGAYEQVLAKHPEFVDAKARLALMSIETKDYDRAHNYIKEALTSQPHNLELRALYTYFLIETNATKLAHDFTLGTLKDHSRHDLYALCAGGMLNYGRARENKDPSPGAAKDRQLKFFRAAEFYDKALLLDPQCAYAAQGLAISIAEGTLGTGVEAGNGTAVTEVAARAKNSRDALTILMKVKDSVNSGSVYVNIGHCHFMREEWERAIESYGTASKRYFNGKNGPTLLYLARSWYHKANKDQSFSDLRQALVHAQAALALQPNDLGIIFNIAIIEQKGVEILFELPPDRRTLAELNIALADGEDSLRLFEQLANDKSLATPYDRDLPGHRLRYGQGLSRRAPDVLAGQEAYEATEAAKVDRAKQARDFERQRLADAEAQRLEEIAKQARVLAEERRAMGEKHSEYVLSRNVVESDEEEKKRKGAGKKRKTKGKKEDKDEVGTSDEEGEKQQPKPKKKKGPKGKAVVDGTDSDGGGDPMDLDSDGEEQVRNGRRKGRSSKTFKSAEIVESGSDDD